METWAHELNGQKPPFKRGDLVHSKSGEKVRSVEYWGISVSPGPHEISRIHYSDNGTWLLEFKNIPEGTRGTPKFPAEEFVLVFSPTTEADSNKPG